MRYLRAGSGPPLILLHGLMGYSLSWRFTIPALARYATVYAVDSVGTGFSDRPGGLDCRLRSGAGRLLSFCDTVGIQDRKSTRLNSSHVAISYAVFCLKKKK